MCVCVRVCMCVCAASFTLSLRFRASGVTKSTRKIISKPINYIKETITSSTSVPKVYIISSLIIKIIRIIMVIIIIIMIIMISHRP